MPVRRPRSNYHDHRQEMPNFARGSKPRGVSSSRMADIKGKPIDRIGDARFIIEEQDELHAQYFDEQARLRLFWYRVVADEGNFQLLISIYGTGDRTQEQLARVLVDDAARISTRLKEFRTVLKRSALSHPEWIAELAPRHQRMILGRIYRQDGLDW